VACGPELIKQLRELTGAGVMDCKRALEEADCDVAKAQSIIQAQGMARAEKRAGREASQGVIESYIHQGRIGALVELNCETDFVARTDDFRALARDIAMQVASMSPKYVSKDEIPPNDATPVSELALLEQPFIRDGSRTIGQLVIETSAKTGEKVAVRRFARFELGRDA
jgi:elongation factor Ts